MPTGIYIRTIEHNRHLSESQMGIKNHRWGKKDTPEQRERKRLSHLGVKRKPHSEETKQKISLAKRGKKNPKRSGEKCHFWKGGITPKNEKIRHSLEYKNWRKSVFERDNYTCQICGHRGGILNADHIKSFAHHVELRFNVDNGRTLCLGCHKKTENYGNKKRTLILLSL
jgi:5-methylcytosine-specific restriction endonuclease McrA